MDQSEVSVFFLQGGCAVADPGFSPGGCANSQNCYYFSIFCWKLHENERIWTPRGARVPGAPLGSANGVGWDGDGVRLELMLDTSHNTFYDNFMHNDGALDIENLKYIMVRYRNFINKRHSYTKSGTRAAQLEESGKTSADRVARINWRHSEELWVYLIQVFQRLSYIEFCIEVRLYFLWPPAYEVAGR